MECLLEPSALTIFLTSLRTTPSKRVSSSLLPEAATLVSPSAKTYTNTPTYVWNAVSNSTQYYLKVNDSDGTKIQQWVTASEAGCSTGTGTCSVTPTARIRSWCGNLVDPNTEFIRGWTLEPGTQLSRFPDLKQQRLSLPQGRSQIPHPLTPGMRWKVQQSIT